MMFDNSAARTFPLARRARWIAVVPLVCAALLLLGLGLLWFLPNVRLAAFDTALSAFNRPVDPARASYPHALLPVLAMSVAPLVFAATMLIVHRLFVRLSKGQVLDGTNAALVSWAGLGFIVFGLCGVLGDTLAILALTASNAPGERVLQIGLNAASVGAVAAGFAFWGLGYVLQEAARVADDQASIL